VETEYESSLAPVPRRVSDIDLFLSSPRARLLLGIRILLPWRTDRGSCGVFAGTGSKGYGCIIEVSPFIRARGEGIRAALWSFFWYSALELSQLSGLRSGRPPQTGPPLLIRTRIDLIVERLD